LSNFVGVLSWYIFKPQPEDGFMKKKAETCRCYDFLITF